MKVQLSEEDIIVQCFANLVSRNQHDEALTILATALSTIIHFMDLEASGFNSAEEAFDDFIETVKRGHKAAEEC